MISTAAHHAPSAPVDDSPRVWGMNAQALHDAFWKARGVQVVRRGERARLERGADLFLLLDPGQMVLFELAALTDRLFWRDASVTRLRIAEPAPDRYGEKVILNRDGQIQCITRQYRATGKRACRVLITSRTRIVRMWMAAPSHREAWRAVRRAVPIAEMDPVKCEGRTYYGGEPKDERDLIERLVRFWPDPSESIDGIERSGDGVWRLATDRIDDDALVVGPAWLGRGSTEETDSCLIGPTWLADAKLVSDGACRTRTIAEISPTETPDRTPRPPRRLVYAFCKRAFDIAFSLIALTLALPVIAYVSIRILLEDGWPIFFAHERQGRGGRTFRCWKFRTMRRDADEIKAQLMEDNQCDGPQFFIKHDPRVTRIGRTLRRMQLDELPQFWNVLTGHMSIVGPRPSPDCENQYCPAWREMRLSVRPGITGIWQIQRTRAPLEDFQEWIKYDIEYVERASFWLDLRICVRTVWVLVLRRRAG